LRQHDLPKIILQVGYVDWLYSINRLITQGGQYVQLYVRHNAVSPRWANLVGILMALLKVMHLLIQQGMIFWRKPGEGKVSLVNVQQATPDERVHLYSIGLRVNDVRRYLPPNEVVGLFVFPD
jgi:hypothetical protein